MIKNKNEIYRKYICNGKLRHYSSIVSFSSVLMEALKYAKKRVDSFEKVSIFSEFFKQQYKTISNDSTFPSSYKYHTNERLSCVNFTSNKV